MSEDNNKNYYLSYGIVFGLLGGTLFSTIIEIPLIWSFGPGLGC